MADALQGFEHTAFTAEGKTRAVHRVGSGPAVIVISEMPGITPSVARFARFVAEAGFTAVLPHVFGDDGRDVSNAYVAGTIARACISREFTVLALGRTSPITTWLRALAAHEHDRCGGPGVGAVGMCFTGGFALAMMVDEVVVAPVLSQPSLPFPVGKADRRRLRGHRARLVARQSPRTSGRRPLGPHRGPRRPARHTYPRRPRPGARVLRAPPGRMNPLAEAWRARGQVVRLCNRKIFTVDIPAQG